MFYTYSSFQWTSSVGLGDPILHRQFYGSAQKCLQQIISCNPLHLSRKLMLRKVKGHKADKRDSDSTQGGAWTLDTFSAVRKPSEPHGGVSGRGVEEGGEICLCLLFVLGSGEHFRGQGNPMPPKFKTTVGFLEAPHIYEHGSPFP